MVAFTEIAPAAETVEVGGQPLTVRAVSARGVAVLLGRFRELRALVAQRGELLAEITPERLIELVPDGVAAIIACGLGLPGDAEAEAFADRLGIGEQLDLLEPILRLTMPKGVGPFVARLAALAGRLGIESQATATPATASPAPSST